jgi:hypothetical protein
LAIAELRAILSSGDVRRCHLVASDLPPWQVEVVIDGIGNFQQSADDLFECVRGLAEQLKPHGIRICYNGMRRDVRPSPMARESTGAKFIYRFKLGEPADPRLAVPIFAEAPCDAIVWPEDQDAYYEQWVASIRGSR